MRPTESSSGLNKRSMEAPAGYSPSVRIHQTFQRNICNGLSRPGQRAGPPTSPLHPTLQLARCSSLTLFTSPYFVLRYDAETSTLLGGEALRFLNHWNRLARAALCQ